MLKAFVNQLLEKSEASKHFILYPKYYCSFKIKQIYYEKQLTTLAENNKTLNSDSINESNH